MGQDDYYSLLGVSRFATQDALKRAYRSLVLRVHPDLNPSDTAADRRTREIIEAYKVLGVPSRRREYDASLAQCISPVRYESCRRNYSPFVSRILAALFFIVLVAASGFFIGEALSDRSLVFRPDIANMDFSLGPVNYGVIPSPDVTNSIQWYSAQEYQLTFGSDRATWYVVRAYTDAANFADMNGHHDSAHFYRASIEQVRNSAPAALL